MNLRPAVMTACLLVFVYAASGYAGAQTVGDLTLEPSHRTPCQSNSGEWATPAEKTCYQTTPDYAETMAFIGRVRTAAPKMVKVEAFGKTGEGRELDVVVVSKDGVFDPGQLHKARRPIVLVQNSIHAGEMDGKDACLALLRDMVISKTQAKLLERAVFVFIPIYNADGHERRSAYNRINQDGPELMGWRGNGTNLNLNRDYMKLDTPEARAFMAMFHRWLPDFYVDDHVTDGADYQYDVTFRIDDGTNLPAATAKWNHDIATPQLAAYVDAHGHLASPDQVTPIDDTDPAKGLAFNANPPRFSTGYMILEGRPGMLVELHMLKDYKTRVTGNYFLLAGLMEIVNRDADRLIALNAAADAEAAQLGSHVGAKFPLMVDWSGETTPFLFHGYQSKRELSPVSGTIGVVYSREPLDVTVPFQTGFKTTIETTLPAAYIIPAQWTKVIDVLTAHQLQIERTTAAWTATVDTYRCTGMMWQQPPFEGRHPTFCR